MKSYEFLNIIMASFSFLEAKGGHDIMHINL